MPNLRSVLNRLKWTKDLSGVEIWYRHRGAPGDMRMLDGSEILSIGRSFLETATASIPYHRILKITYRGELVFDRAQL